MKFESGCEGRIYMPVSNDELNVMLLQFWIRAADFHGIMYNAAWYDVHFTLDAPNYLTLLLQIFLNFSWNTALVLELKWIHEWINWKI